MFINPKNKIMKIKTVYLLLLIAIFTSDILMAQNFQGVATYRSLRLANVVGLDSMRVNHERRKLIQEMINKQYQKTYALIFNNYESIYKEIPEDESLDKPNPNSNNNIKTSIYFFRGSSIYYRNVKENRYTNETEFLGKEFLVKGDLESQDWVITGETKKIGAYTCYKANRTNTIYSSLSKSTSINDEESNKKEDSKSKEITVVAWYTTDIPVNHGPIGNWGLPGLILEINNGVTVSICINLVLNPKEKITIEEPIKGKEISGEDYDKLMKKKFKSIGHGGE